MSEIQGGSPEPILHTLDPESLAVLRNIFTQRRSKIDPYILHDFTSQTLETGLVDPTDTRPMLVQTTTTQWDHSTILDLQVLGNIHNIHAAIASLRSLVGLELDPNVISVESSKTMVKED